MSPSAGALAIEQAYTEAFPRSRALYERAKRHLPGGVSSTLREHKPFPLYVERAAGARKWSVEGHELIDYWMGHSALLLGHNRAEVQEAAARQLSRGTHFGSVFEDELLLAELITTLVPSAERVRFIGTGSEAVHLALRLARAATGRSAFIKLAGHFHGWHDDVVRALRPPFDTPLSAGVPTDDDAGAVVLRANDLASVEQAFAARADIGAVMLEPHGGYGGLVATEPAYVAGLRKLCDAHGAVLIFDETVTGFRFAPGGYEELHGVRPDLSIYGKALFGGFPGAALAGKAALMELTSSPGSPSYVYHGGTWNAFTLSMAAGLVNLRLLRDGIPQQRAAKTAAALRAGLGEVLRARGLDADVRGKSSMLVLFSPYPEASVGEHAKLLPVSVQRYSVVRQALVLEGIDLPRFPCGVSAAHDEDDVAETVRRFGRAIDRLLAAGVDLDVR